jgi:hypothetical protein
VTGLLAALLPEPGDQRLDRRRLLGDGEQLGLRLSPERARAAAGFDWFAIGVPDREAIDQLAARLTMLGERHAGVHWASIGWILPELRDPDGHEVRFYTVAHHTDLAPGTVTTITDPREGAERRERAQAAVPEA